MLFNSTTFFVFFAVVYVVYVPSPRWVQNLLLLAASYVFYGWWDWRFLSLILISTVVDYLCARAIDSGPQQHRRRWLLVSLCTNLGILASFKYFDFFVQSFATSCEMLGWPVSTTTLNLVLPVGISFYTFQTMGYTIDVYRGRMSATRSPITFALYVAFFPQLVAGPIERATTLIPQIDRDRRLDWNQVREGAWLILFGLFKKVVVADNMARIVDPVFEAGEVSTGATTLIAVYAFALQIYCDFSGYTDIARGISKLLGFELMLNFRRPYFATNPRDFWQRWHISLSQWLRDYLYISLGGNRGGRVRTHRNLMLTMLLGGLWHGASWMFVIWGFIHGGVLIVHRVWVAVSTRLVGDRITAPSWLGPLTYPLRWFAFFHVVCLAWIYFRAESMEVVGQVLAQVAVGLASSMWMSTGDWTTVRFMVLCTAPLVVLDVAEEIHERVHGRAAPPFIFTLPSIWRGFVYASLVISMAILGARGGVEFIYFQF